MYNRAWVSRPNPSASSETASWGGVLGFDVTYASCHNLYPCSPFGYFVSLKTQEVKHLFFQQGRTQWALRHKRKQEPNTTAAVAPRLSQNLSGNVCFIGTQIGLSTKLAFCVSHMILFGWIFQLFPENLVSTYTEYQIRYSTKKTICMKHSMPLVKTLNQIDQIVYI